MRIGVAHKNGVSVQALIIKAKIVPDAPRADMKMLPTELMVHFTINKKALKGPPRKNSVVRIVHFGLSVKITFYDY